MAEVQPKPAADGSRRVYVWWGVGFAFLLVLGLACWLVVGPVVQVRRLADLHRQGRLSASEVVARLGGQEKAVSRLLLHLRVTLRTGADWYLHDVLEVLCCCEVPAGPAPRLDLKPHLKVDIALLVGGGGGSWESVRSAEEVERARAGRERRLRWADWFAGGPSPAPLPAGRPTPSQ